jgi:hypothetical protein
MDSNLFKDTEKILHLEDLNRSLDRRELLALGVCKCDMHGG